MSTERSDAVYFAYRHAQDKLDYFMAGVAGALTAYVGKDLDVQQFVFGGATFGVVAVVLFGVSFFAALQRLATSVVEQWGEAKRLHLYVEASPEATRTADAMGPELKRVSRRQILLYKIRNWCLYAGVASLVVARLLPAFGRP